MSIGFRAMACAVVLAALGAVQASAASFDRPLHTVRVALPRDPDNLGNRARVSCFYFPRFMVKEVDLGEVGAEQLSIVPIHDPTPPACERANRADEHVVPSTVWSGYFKGVKGDYVVFTAGDGWNGGMGFAVFDARTGAKLFEDAVKGRFHGMSAKPANLVLRYQRVFAAKCSMAASTSCWKQIKAETDLMGRPPNCKTAYAREIRRNPKQADEIRNDPTVIEYDVVAVMAPEGHDIRPGTARVSACAPAE